MKHFPQSRYVSLSLIGLEKSSRVLSCYGWKALFGLVELAYFHHHLETIPGVLALIFLDLLCATGIVLSAGTNTVNPISKCSAHFQGLSPF